MTEPHPQQYWLIDKAGIEWLEQLAAQSNFANGKTLSKIIDDVHSRPAPSEQICKWIENENGAYDTSCGNCFEVMNDTPEENKMNFCPYCGKLLRRTPQAGR